MSDKKTGTLYVVATPIGNLGDISFRAIETLKKVDLIAAEDTRHSRILLEHYEIDTPTTSYHEHNKYEKAQQLVEKLLAGTNIAVITDAGTPAISDPGEVLVKYCKEQGIAVTSVPGACAGITALTISGLPTRRFVFEGFLPSEKPERDAVIERLKTEERTCVLYEAPHRLKKTLQLLARELGERRICLCRELTKVHEEAEIMSLPEAAAYYNENDPRGEYVLVLEGRNSEELKAEESQKWESMSLAEHLELYTSRGMDKKEAMKQMAADRGCSKRDIYQALICEDDSAK